MLGGLGLLLTHHADHRHQAHMHKAHVGGSNSELELAQGLDERHGLDISHSASQLDHTHIRHTLLAINRGVGHALDPVLACVSDVRDHLHCLAQVVTTALALDHRLIQFPSGDVVVLSQRNIQEPLVVAQVKVSLSTIVEHKDLAVLKRRHSAGINVQVRVNFDGCHSEAAVLQKDANATGRHTFPQTAHNTTGNNNVFHCALFESHLD
mmetsp:Transcript_25504/g.55480  ORF Transcript_25504/g.55480 Transcript_25504/m.55480 type:complete len:209 (-) Transcript_25504:164-790(-)